MNFFLHYINHVQKEMFSDYTWYKKLLLWKLHNFNIGKTDSLTKCFVYFPSKIFYAVIEYLFEKIRKWIDIWTIVINKFFNYIMIYKFDIAVLIIEIIKNKCKSYKKFEGLIEIIQMLNIFRLVKNIWIEDISYKLCCFFYNKVIICHFFRIWSIFNSDQ